MLYICIHNRICSWNPSGAPPEPKPVKRIDVRCLIKICIGKYKSVVWNDPDYGKLMRVRNGNQGPTCLTCPEKPPVGDINRTHDAEQHFVQYLEFSEHHKKRRKIEDIWLTLSPCAVCSDTMIKYFQSHDTKLERWRPTIHFSNLYMQNVDSYQQLHREGLKNLLIAGFRLEAIDPKLFLKKHIDNFDSQSRRFLESEEINNKTQACLHAVKGNCYHPVCGQFGTESLPDCPN